METRLVPDPQQKQMYENKLKRLTEELNTCANDLSALKSNTARGELFVGSNQTSNMSNEVSGEEAGNMMLNEMDDIQDKTKASLMNTRNMVAASKQVGEATMEELLRQREQVRNIDNEAMRIEDNLNRADKLIKTFGKRMATDRVIQCFACVNVLLLAGVVIYSVLKDGKLGGENTTAPIDPTTGDNRMLRGLLFNEDQSSHFVESM